MIATHVTPLARSIDLWPEQASTFAGPVDLLYIALCLVSLFFTVAIAGAVLFLAIRYRRRSEDEIPEEIHGNNTLEIVWSVIPLVLLLVVFVWGAGLFFRMQRPPSDAMEILVTGKQWMWKIQHPNGQREINNLHVPAGQPIVLTMTSEDVIHSFFVPAFRTKQDVVPGKYTQSWFTPTKEGTYRLFCAEYCGTEHSRMGGFVHVMSPADYEAWLSGGVSTESPSAAGERLFASLGCVTCHAGGATAQGPALAGVFGTLQPLANGMEVMADENYIRESILYPQEKLVQGYGAIMPTYNGMVSEMQLSQLIAYVKSIGGGEVVGAAPAQGEPAEEKNDAEGETPVDAPETAPVTSTQDPEQGIEG